LQALGVLFRMAIETKFLDMEAHKFFFRMCQPNINAIRVSMIRLTETTSSKSLTNAILCDTSKSLAQVPNLDAQIYVLPYQITAEGPSETRAQLFSNMGFTLYGMYEKNVKFNQWADAITDDSVNGFLKLFKIECDTTDPIKSILPYLQKYKTLYSNEDWIAMGKDAEFEENMESKSTSKLQRVLVKWIQEKNPIGLMATNGANRIAKAVYHGKAWQDIYETWYNGTQKTTNHLLKNPTSILEIHRDSILYQGISVTVHCPKQKCCTKEIIQDLMRYSAANDQQGILVGVRSWRDTVQSAMEALVDGK
jgi:hypothetical protein